MDIIEAAKYGNLNRIIELIREGFDINLQNRGGYTPLHIAIIYGQLGIVNTLIYAGADVNLPNYFENTPLHFAAGARGATNNHLDIVNVLITLGADVNLPNNNNNTPLHIAATNNHLDIVIALIDGGANLNIRNNRGETPLEAAQINDNHNIVDFINKYKLIRTRQRLNLALGLSHPSSLDSLKGGLDPWAGLLTIPNIPKEVLLRKADEDFLQSFADEGIYFTPRSGPKFGGKKRTKIKSNR